MLHFFHELDLSFDRLPTIWLLEFILLVNFHGYLFVGWLV